MLILLGLQAGWPEVGCRRPAIASTIIIMIFINIIITISMRGAAASAIESVGGGRAARSVDGRRGFGHGRCVRGGFAATCSVSCPSQPPHAVDEQLTGAGASPSTAPVCPSTAHAC